MAKTLCIGGKGYPETKSREPEVETLTNQLVYNARTAVGPPCTRSSRRAARRCDGCESRSSSTSQRPWRTCLRTCSATRSWARRRARSASSRGMPRSSAREAAGGSTRAPGPCRVHPGLVPFGKEVVHALPHRRPPPRVVPAAHTRRVARVHLARDLLVQRAVAFPEPSLLGRAAVAVAVAATVTTSAAVAVAAAVHVPAPAPPLWHRLAPLAWLALASAPETSLLRGAARRRSCSGPHHRLLVAAPCT